VNFVWKVCLRVAISQNRPALGVLAVASFVPEAQTSEDCHVIIVTVSAGSTQVINEYQIESLCNQRFRTGVQVCCSKYNINESLCGGYACPKETQVFYSLLTRSLYWPSSPPSTPKRHASR
jgi:hypothetical protein